MSAGRRERHRRRVVTGRGLTVHLRAFGVQLPKMYRWIEDHAEVVRSVLSRRLRGEDHDARMSAAGIARGDYRPDRSEILTGAAAYIREKRVLMKYLGLQRNDWTPTRRLADYIRQVESGTDPSELLARYGLEAKLMCPQIRSYIYRPAMNQASYAHCRIRPYVMLLYGLRLAKEHGILLNTDDIALSVLRFYPPQAQPQVTEDFLKGRIEEYVSRKADQGIDYEEEWTELLEEVETEIGGDLHSDPLIFKQKCRNGANNVWCFLIFARNVSWIDAEFREPDHWSASRQEYRRRGLTFSVAYEEVAITAKGERDLADALDRVPVWYEDVVSGFPERPFDAAAVLNQLAHRGRVSGDGIDEEWIRRLSSLGLSVRREGNEVVVDERPLFSLPYDIP